MFILTSVLRAKCKVKIADDSDHCESEELVPRTNGYISTLLQHIWRPSAPNPITPCLDAAQSIIMLGSTVQWCWKQWTDPREADAEVIAFFVRPPHFRLYILEKLR